MSVQELLTVEQAAEEFGVHRTTLFRAIADKKLSAHRRVGDRRTFVGRWDVQRLVDPPAVTRCLELIYRHFTSTGDWPVAGQVQRRLAQESELGKEKDEFDFLGALESLPQELGWRVRDLEGRAQLSLRGIARCQNSTEDINAFLTLVRTCYERYVGADEKLTVTSVQLAEAFGFGKLTLDKLFKLMQVEAPFWISLGGLPDGGWELAIDGDRIRHCREIQSVSDYLAAKQRMFQPKPAPQIPPLGIHSRRALGGSAQALHPAIASAVRDLPDTPGGPLVVAAAAALEGLMADRLGDRKRYGRNLTSAFFDMAQRASPADLRRLEAIRAIALSAMGAFRNPAAHGRLDVSSAQAREIVGLFSLLAREVEAVALPIVYVWVPYREANGETRSAFAAAGLRHGLLPSADTKDLPESWFCNEHQSFIDRADLGLTYGEGTEPMPVCPMEGCPGRGWEQVHPEAEVGTVGISGQRPVRVGTRIPKGGA